MTSEVEFGISKQPKDTCPMLDDALAEIAKVERILSKLNKNADADELLNELDAIDTALFWGTTPQQKIEEARDNVIKIREWGQEWKDKALELAEELSETRQEAQP